MSITIAEQTLLASMKARMPVVLVGPPGVGKSAKLYELGERMGYEVITIIGSQLDPTDIVGLPKAETVGESEDGEPIHGTVYLSPWWQVRILLKKKVILFLDEMSNTSAAVRASMLAMLQSREFPNGQKMPRETIIVGAMNPAEQAADGYDLDYPTTNRINFIVWSPSIEEWKEGMLNAWGKTVSPEELVWRQKIVDFISDNPSELQKLPSTVSSPEAFGVNPRDASEMEVLRYAWPSRRSWDNLSRTLPFANDTFVQDALAQGIVGYAAAAKFRDWLQRNSQMSPQELMANPKAFDWSKASQDEANFLLRSVLDSINDSKSSKQALMVFIEIARQGNQGVGAGFIRELMAKTTESSLGSDTVERNRKGLRQITQAFSSVARNM